MPKFLIKATYTSQGVQGLRKEGGSGRREAVKKLIESMGGQLDAFYFSYGEADAYVICDVPSPQVGLALSIAVNASGVVRVSTVPLIMPEEMDAACQMSASYRAPGT